MWEGRVGKEHSRSIGLLLVHALVQAKYSYYFPTIRSSYQDIVTCTVLQQTKQGWETSLC